MSIENIHPSEVQIYKAYADFVPGALCVVLREFNIFGISDELTSRNGRLSVGELFLVTQGYTTQLRPRYYTLRIGPRSTETYTQFSIMCREKIYSPSTSVVQYPSDFAKVVA